MLTLRGGLAGKLGWGVRARTGSRMEDGLLAVVACVHRGSRWQMAIAQVAYDARAARVHLHIEELRDGTTGRKEQQTLVILGRRSQS